MNNKAQDMKSKISSVSLFSSKKAQMELSFGMIFSILLIIVFVVFAFYGISKFMTFQKEIKYKQFSEDFQSDVEKLWKSSSGSKSLEYSLPSETSKICFVNEESWNLEFTSKKPRKDLNIKYLNLEKTLNGEDQLCIENLDGSVKFKIQKSYGESSVTVSK